MSCGAERTVPDGYDAVTATAGQALAGRARLVRRPGLRQRGFASGKAVGDSWPVGSAVEERSQVG